MGKFTHFAWHTGISVMMMGIGGTAAIAQTNQPLSVVYPPDNHETTANQIFLIGTAPAAGEVEVNGDPIARSPAGHFAPSFPLQRGENVFTLRYQDEELVIRVNRVSADLPAPIGTAFAEGSLTPAVDIARRPTNRFALVRSPQQRHRFRQLGQSNYSPIASDHTQPATQLCRFNAAKPAHD
ncbi:MAG: hypothetical protein HC840_24955 [Leptolyngbyaceae cyanobacterium RM2_2_4]|nr:hypothetical protein [Leptolyngbyaceae cyanobacterium RM2_2_4]